MFRERAGVVVSGIIVCSFIAYGFVQIVLGSWLGKPVVIPGDWSAAMLSLASAALGFLIGKQSSQPATGQTEAIARAAVDRVTETKP